MIRKEVEIGSQRLRKERLRTWKKSSKWPLKLPRAR